MSRNVKLLSHHLLISASRASPLSSLLVFFACERGFSIRASGDEEAVGRGRSVGGLTRCVRRCLPARIRRNEFRVRHAACKKELLNFRRPPASVRSKEWVGWQRLPLRNLNCQWRSSCAFFHSFSNRSSCPPVQVASVV